jgi:hypothetical protein
MVVGRRASPPGLTIGQARTPGAPRSEQIVFPSYLPVPFNVEDCGLLVALSGTVNVPSRVPVAVGLNTTLIVHLAFATRVVVHVVEDSLKSPVVEITMLLIAELRLLVSVNTFATLVVPTVCDANVALVGVNATGGAPVPERATV